MAQFTVKINCSTHAFQENQNGELARILSDIAGKIGAGAAVSNQGASQTIRDSRGNDVGRWKLHNDGIEVSLIEK
jgi:hypothetical protein